MFCIIVLAGIVPANVSQAQAVLHLNGGLEGLHGPPGTGVFKIWRPAKVISRCYHLIAG